MDSFLLQQENKRRRESTERKRFGQKGLCERIKKENHSFFQKNGNLDMIPDEKMENVIIALNFISKEDFLREISLPKEFYICYPYNTDFDNPEEDDWKITNRYNHRERVKKGNGTEKKYTHEEYILNFKTN